MGDTPVMVLVVDDSQPMRNRLIELLGGIEGCAVSGQAEYGSHAIGLAELRRPDVVILDIRLPDMSGLDVLKAVKRMIPAPVVAVLTNHSDEAIRRLAEELGADFIFDKATDFDRIRTVIGTVVHHKTLQSDAQRLLGGAL